MFALDGYLARLRLGARPSPDAAGLDLLQRAHRQAIPFENLDVRLGRGISLAPDAVFAKLVTARRGGYCFEHNRLFGDALTALGFAHRPLLARVWLAADGVPPLTHTLSLVTIDGREWVADAGFGGTDTPVLPLADGAEGQAPDGARFRLAREGGGWMLYRDGDPATTDGRDTAPGWRPQYGFDLAEVFPADLLLANHWTATAPASRFVRQTVVSIVLPHGLAALTDRRYRRRAGAEDVAGEIDDPRVYRMRLSLMFGIDLTREEVAGLRLFGEAPT
jgi:N-hydroxyarylamine O-acetyltransferase